MLARITFLAWWRAVFQRLTNCNKGRGQKGASRTVRRFPVATIECRFELIEPLLQVGEDLAMDA